MADIKMPSTLVKCDLCHREFPLNRNQLTESKITLEKVGLDPKEVVLTTMECPCCGKSYPVIMDDAECLELSKELTAIYQHRAMYQARFNKVPAKLNKKYTQLERKLRFKRKTLADEYKGSFYQSVEGKQQLDYCYHVQ